MDCFSCFYKMASISLGFQIPGSISKFLACALINWWSTKALECLFALVLVWSHISSELVSQYFNPSFRSWYLLHPAYMASPSEQVSRYLLHLAYIAGVIYYNPWTSPHMIKHNIMSLCESVRTPSNWQNSTSIWSSLRVLLEKVMRQC